MRCPALSFQSIDCIDIIRMTDIKAIDLNLLRVLDALLQERHVTRAAKMLNLSQPATSAALSRLRDMLADPLLVRTSHGMVATERGLELAPQVHHLMEQIDQTLAPSAPFDPATAETIFNVAATDYFIELINAPLAERLQNFAPHIKFAWRGLPGIGGGNLSELMERDAYDLAITRSESAPPNLRGRSLMTETFVGIANPNTAPMIGIAPTLSLAAFCAKPHVLVSPRGVDVFHSAMDDALAARGLARHVAFSVPQFRFAVDIVERTDTLAIFPARIAARYQHRIARFELPIQSTFGISMVWHERKHRSPAQAWLREQMLLVAREQV